MAEEFSVTDLLPHYYDRIFPSKLFQQWLGYGDCKHFSNREIAYTFKNEIFSRYNSFPSGSAFRADLIRQVPEKIHVGPVYNWQPKHRDQIDSTQFQYQERELIFDIDANEYDNVRVCACRGTPSVCSICWSLMEIAMDIIDTALRQDFGFEYLLWVFSGRRGVHCWVCDKLARTMGQDGRTAIANYFSISELKDKHRGVLSMGKALHPSLSRAYHTQLLPYFEKLVHDHHLLDRVEFQDAVLQFVPNSTLAQSIREKWRCQHSTSGEKWMYFKEQVKQGGYKTRPEVDVVFFFAYPRLDTQVSIHWNHLLKAPLSIHPSTGKICVPIIPDQPFDPMKVPTIQQVVEELDQIYKNAESHTKSSHSASSDNSLEKTSLGPYIEYMWRFCNEMQVSQVVQERRDKIKPDSLSF